MELIYPVALDYPFVRDLFEGLETGDGAEFFQHVDDNVDWTSREHIRLRVTIVPRPPSWLGPSTS